MLFNDQSARRLEFDIETDGFLADVTRVHCLCIHDLATGEYHRFRQNALENTIPAGLRMLEEADVLIGHNIIKYDIPVLKKLYPKWQPKAEIFDTIGVSNLIWTDIIDTDMKMNALGKLPKEYIKKHKLEAWGYRLGILKGEYKGPWDAWNQEMDDYCEQDVRVTHALFQKICEKNYSPQAFEIEMAVLFVIAQQERNGFLFDQKAAEDLYVQLVAKRLELEEKLKETFGSWLAQDGPVRIPKKNNKVRGIIAGCQYTKLKVVEFNPRSRDHIAYVLQKRRGWVPKDFTDGGKPAVDEEILKDLPYPEIPLLCEYLMLQKRIGQLAEGDHALMKLVNKDGRIYGGVNPNGAVTGRMTHMNPNMAQIPKVGNPFGKEFRSLFIAPEGRLIVGIDASGLELRMLAHYLAKTDGGEYAKVVTEGDVHSFNQKKAGLSTRDLAKRFIYAFLYGASDGKIGEICGVGVKGGRNLKETFLAELPALKDLKEGLVAAARQRGFLYGLDRRQLKIRSMHAILNVLLQSAGAVVMKQAAIILDRWIRERGLDAKLVATVHDEFQFECAADCAAAVGELGVKAIEEAGRVLGIRCPLTGEYKVGRSWAETH